MRKNRKLIITIIIIVILLIVGALAYYQVFYDANRLTISEREWIDKNKSNVITINVPNDLNVFGLDGTGVFYDFISQVEKKQGMEFNRNATSLSTSSDGLGFLVTSQTNPEDRLIYRDHYVLVSKTEESIAAYRDIQGSKIGIAAEALGYISNYYDEAMSYTSYNSKNALIEAFKASKEKYIIVPKTEYLDIILSEGYKVVYHFSDLVVNYYLHLGTNKTLNSILTKACNVWLASDFEDAYYSYLYEFYVNQLGLTQSETDTLTNRTYSYGFVASTPYQTLTSSKHGGIALSYLSDFSKLSKVEFIHTKYRFNNSLIKAFNSEKVDLIFNNTNLEVSFHQIFTNLNHKFYIISPISNTLNLTNLKAIATNRVVVLENSKIYQYLKTFPEIRVAIVSNEKELFKQAKNNEIIAIDAYTYDYYVNNKISDYSIRYTGYLPENHSFKYINNEDAFYRLFNAYISTLDQNDLINQGLISYKDAAKSGNFIANIAQYTIFLASGGAIAIIYLYYRKNRLVLDTKIRKDDKLKFIDMLTSLKNRNYLTEKKEVWNQNTIYPQAAIVIDLNNIKYLNDTFGHAEGDKQIKAAANSLIKTQLDNTEIMRTDGNEFTIYMVGYSEKQVLNYMKKLLKEFRDLPYEYGAAFGFSMIVDDLKLIDDAINEASMKMRENKEKQEGNNEEKSYNE